MPYPAHPYARSAALSAILIAGGLAAAAPVQAQSAAAGGANPQAQGGAGQNETGRSSISTADSTLMRELAKANLAEIQMSGLAQSISDNKALRNLAQTLLSNHGSAMTELRQLAAAKGVVLPGGPDKEHAAALRKLALLTGDDFNREFLAQAGTGAHEQSIKLFQDAGSRAKDAELKAYAAKYLPVLNAHLQMVQQAQGAGQQPPAAAK